MQSACRTLVIAATYVTLSARLIADEPKAVGRLPAFPKPSSEEPIAKNWSREKAATFLGSAGLRWLQQKNCMACHTGYPFLMAGPSFGPKPNAGLVKMREYLEGRVARWDSGVESDKPEPGDEGITEVVATATTLAFHDAQTTGKLHPLTRKALDRIWTIQQDDGAWDWNKHRLPPLEYDDYFGAVFAALGVGVAPEGYTRSTSAKEGVAKLREYLAKHPAPNLHHRIWLLWASLGFDGLMTEAEKQQTIKDLLALQRPDGGWNLPSLGDWKRLDESANDKNAASDGYSTGLVIYVLRQAGVSRTAESINSGVHWLETNQRESGRWFTRSLNADRDHYISNAGTAFASMALNACEARRSKQD